MANGISRYPSGSTAFARVGSGLLNSYLQWRNEQLSQRQMDQQNQMTLQRDQANRDFQIQQQQAGYERADAVAATNRTNDETDQHKKFVQSILVATAEQGALDNDIVEELRAGGDLDDNDYNLLLKLSSGVKADKESKAKIDLMKATKDGSPPKPVNPSDVYGDAKAEYGEDVGDEAVRAISDYMQQHGVPYIYASRSVYPDPTKVPRKTDDSSGGLGAEAKALRDFETTRGDTMKNLAAAGVPIMSVVDRIVAGKEDPDDAARHATADHYAKQIVSAMQIDPNAPISMEAINSVLRQAKLEAIPGAGQRTLPDLVDEMIARNVGANGKKPQLETIMAIIQQAMSPQQPQQQGSALGRGIMNTMADIIPGIQRSDFKQKGTGMAGAVKPRAQGFDRP